MAKKQAKKKAPPRKRVPEFEVLVLRRCRRQCCLCFGLRGDADVKDGQIVHLDRDRSNTVPQNLAFLCLECHKNYDRKSNRVKAYTPGEVLYYRELLHKSLGDDRIQWEIHVTASQEESDTIRRAVFGAHRLLLENTSDVTLTERPVT